MEIRNKNRKIAFFTSGQYPVPATSGGAVESLVEMLLSDSSNSIDNPTIDVITSYTFDAAAKAERMYNNIEFKYIKFGKWLNSVYALAKRIFKRLFSFDPVILSPYFIKSVLTIIKNDYQFIIVENKPQFVIPLRWFYKKKIILHLHNDTLNLSTKRGCKIVEKCDLIICVSDYIRKRVNKVNPIGKPVVTLHNVIDYDLFRNCRRDETIRRKIGVEPEEFLVLFSGRIIPDKGVSLLIQAINAIKQKNIKLVIVGGSAYEDSTITDYEKKCKKIAEESGGRIIFTGYIPYATMPLYYKASDLAVFPSIWEEPAGLVVVEAQACGIPVVITNSGGMTEYVSKNSAIVLERDDNLIENLKKTILLIYSNRELHYKMSREAIITSKYFSKFGYFDSLFSYIKKYC